MELEVPRDPRRADALLIHRRRIVRTASPVVRTGGARGALRWGLARSGDSVGHGLLLLPALLALVGAAQAQTAGTPPSAEPVSEEFWYDRAQLGLHRFVWHSARTIDGWMGPPKADEVYQEAAGSISIATLWDEFEGFDVKVRFGLDLPLPTINERLHLFVGRVNPEEFVTERVEPASPIPPLLRETNEEDKALAGLIYRKSGRRGNVFSASVGTSFDSGNLDPYVKAAYQIQRTLWTDTLVTAKETLFYRRSEGFGSTTRLHLERMLGEDWRLRASVSGTISEESEGVRGFGTLTATRSLSGRRALIFRAGANGETEADVPLRDFGVKVAYRAAVVRPWLILEVYTGLTWPKHLPEQARTASPGIGIGCEVYFGKNEFSSSPMTF